MPFDQAAAVTRLLGWWREADPQPPACLPTYSAREQARRIHDRWLPLFRANFAASRNQARQFVRHGHVLVNGKRVTIPSFKVRQGDVVEIGPKAKNFIVVRHNADTIDRAVPLWLETTSGELKVTVRDLPLREQIDIPVREQLIVELYSK